MLVNFLDLDDIRKNLKNKKFEIFLKIEWESLIICKFLEIFLKKNLISFSINPFQDVVDFENFVETFFKKNRIDTNIMFINFGAENNFKNLFSFYGIIFHNIYIIDKSRYINFHNITSKKIFILNSTKNFDPRIPINKSKSVQKKFLPSFYEILKDKNFLGLWLKILTWTRNYMNNILCRSQYKKKVEKLKKSFYPSKHIENFLFFQGKKVTLKKNYKKTIQIKKEVPVYLLNEWNLFEALLNNVQLGTYFELWKKGGIKNIAKFFLRIGFTLKEASEKWEVLPLEKKNKFQKNLEKESRIIGVKFESIEIFKIIFPLDMFGMRKERSETSAFDFILSIETLSDFKLFSSDKNNQRKGFWTAYKSFNKSRNLKKGIFILQGILKFTSKMTRIILSQKVYVSERLLNYVFVKNPKNIKISYQLARHLSIYLDSAFSRLKKKNFCLFLCHKEKTWVFGFLNEIEKITEKKVKREKLLELGAILENVQSFSLLINTADCKIVQNIFR